MPKNTLLAKINVAVHLHRGTNANNRLQIIRTTTISIKNTINLVANSLTEIEDMGLVAETRQFVGISIAGVTIRSKPQYFEVDAIKATDVEGNSLDMWGPYNRISELSWIKPGSLDPQIPVISLNFKPK